MYSLFVELLSLNKITLLFMKCIQIYEEGTGKILILLGDEISTAAPMETVEVGVYRSVLLLSRKFNLKSLFILPYFLFQPSQHNNVNSILALLLTF